MIVDANVILRAFFPDEAQERAQAIIEEHVAGRIPLKAPDLLPYELANAVWQAERRGRITHAQADEILQAMSGLEIEIVSEIWGVPPSWEGMLPLARRFNLSVYDAAYLMLAKEGGEPLLTGDLRLYNSVHPELDWVLWIEDYPKET
jgi:predicted nucleic acid-binding protein